MTFCLEHLNWLALNKKSGAHPLFTDCFGNDYLFQCSLCRVGRELGLATCLSCCSPHLPTSFPPAFPMASKWNGPSPGNTCVDCQMHLTRESSQKAEHLQSLEDYLQGNERSKTVIKIGPSLSPSSPLPFQICPYLAMWSQFLIFLWIILSLKWLEIGWEKSYSSSNPVPLWVLRREGKRKGYHTTLSLCIQVVG
jgi:hypothetical protein